MFYAGTGNTVIKAVEVMQKHGVKEESITLLTLFCTPSGKTHAWHPIASAERGGLLYVSIYVIIELVELNSI